jgi:hypothetical protein
MSYISHQAGSIEQMKDRNSHQAATRKEEAHESRDLVKLSPPSFMCRRHQTIARLVSTEDGMDLALPRMPNVNRKSQLPSSLFAYLSLTTFLRSERV